MKYIVATIISIVSAAGATAQTPIDTIADITDATRMIITESASEMSVKIAKDTAGLALTEIASRPLDNVVVTQRHWNSPFRQPLEEGHSKWDLIVGGPGIGWIDAVGQPSGLGLEMGKSLEISWLNALSIAYFPSRWTGLSFGVGFDWRNYRISTSQHRFTPGEETPLGLAPYPEGATAHGSRLKVFSLGFPLLYRQTIPIKWLDGQYFNFSLGAVFNYNAHGSMLSKWTEADGRDVKQRTNHIGQRKFTVDFIGIVKIGWGVQAYVRYSPQTVLKGTGSYQFKPLSTGLILFY